MANEGARLDQRLARRGGPIELLRLPALLFSGVARLRARGYERGWLPRERVDAPVVSVGNLSAGGTGKTPFVAFLARELRSRGWRPGILARGYGARREHGQGPGNERVIEPLNDEGRWLARALPGIPQRQDPDRARAAGDLIRAGADLLILDDGFQHRRLARDLDLVLVDATRPWGLPRPPDGSAPVRACLPRGLLREPPGALARAHALVVTRSDQVPPGELAELQAELERLAPGRGVLVGRHRPAQVLGPAGELQPPSVLAGRELDLVSAIGNPEAFQRTVEGLGARVVTHRVFPDHHGYRASDLAGLGAGGRWLLTTEKDAVKLDGMEPRPHVLSIEFELMQGASLLAALLEALRPGRERAARAVLHEGLHG